MKDFNKTIINLDIGSFIEFDFYHYFCYIGLMIDISYCPICAYPLFPCIDYNNKTKLEGRLVCKICLYSKNILEDTIFLRNRKINLKCYFILVYCFSNKFNKDQTKLFFKFFNLENEISTIALYFKIFKLEINKYILQSKYSNFSSKRKF